MWGAAAPAEPRGCPCLVPSFFLPLVSCLASISVFVKCVFLYPIFKGFRKEFHGRVSLGSAKLNADRFLPSLLPHFLFLPFFPLHLLSFLSPSLPVCVSLPTEGSEQSYNNV